MALALEQTSSQLFTLRVWVEEVDNGRFEIRGALKHVLTGDTHHFRDWATLTQLIESFVAAEQAPTAGGTA